MVCQSLNKVVMKFLGKKGQLFICNLRENEYLGRNIVTAIVCCVRCVAFYVTLINSGVNVQLLIECNQEQLCGNYTHAHDFFLEDGSDSDDLSDYDQHRLFKQQLCQSFCFTELRMYNFKYHRLCYMLGNLLKLSLNESYIKFPRKQKLEFN